MKIEEYLATLPQSILSGQEVQLPDSAFREIFNFVELDKDDIFYHLGCGDGKGIYIALKEFGVREAVGIDIDVKKINLANKLLNGKNCSNYKLQCRDVRDVDFTDASVILFWFVDPQIIDNMMEKFSSLKRGCKIITIWGPLPGCLPNKVDFPYILNTVPFEKANDLKEQVLAVFRTDCVDFVTAWEFAERYTRAIGLPDAGNDRFLTILQTLVIWINAKNLGIACGRGIPQSVRTYINILQTFFDIDVSYLLDKPKGDD